MPNNENHPEHHPHVHRTSMYRKLKDVNLGPSADFPVEYEQLKTHITAQVIADSQDHEARRKLDIINGIEKILNHTHIGFGFMQIKKDAADFVIGAFARELQSEFSPELQHLTEANIQAQQAKLRQ